MIKYLRFLWFNLKHWYFCCTWQRTFIATKTECFNISPEAVRMLAIGPNIVSFYCSFQGYVECINIKTSDIQSMFSGGKST